MQTLYFDAEYIGPRYRYGAHIGDPRVCGLAPKGWIIKSYKPNRDYPFGTIDYPYPLTDNEINGYELIEIGKQ